MSGCHPETLVSAVKTKSDVEILLERIIKLENFVGQNYKVDHNNLLDILTNLSIRLKELEDWTRKDEDVVHARLKVLELQQVNQDIKIVDLQDSWVNMKLDIKGDE